MGSDFFMGWSSTGLLELENLQGFNAAKNYIRNPDTVSGTFHKIPDPE